MKIALMMNIARPKRPQTLHALRHPVITIRFIVKAEIVSPS